MGKAESPTVARTGIVGRNAHGIGSLLPRGPGIGNGHLESANRATGVRESGTIALAPRGADRETVSARGSVRIEAIARNGRIGIVRGIANGTTIPANGNGAKIARAIASGAKSARANGNGAKIARAIASGAKSARVSSTSLEIGKGKGASRVPAEADRDGGEAEMAGARGGIATAAIAGMPGAAAGFSADRVAVRTSRIC